MNANKNIVVLGAGISGLTQAYLLSKNGYDVTVLEKNPSVGGSIDTVKENGFLFDRGPNSALEITPLIGHLINELNLSDQLVYANKKGNKRYILKNNKLIALPMSPVQFLKSDLFSARAKLRLMAEPLIGKSKDGYYQSISRFVKRRLGKEFLDYAIDPFVAGVYAGNPDMLSVKSAFPKLYELEEKYGGLIWGTVRSIKERKRRPEQSKQSAKMLSFKNGMSVLPNALANYLGESVMTSAEVKSITKNNNVFEIEFLHNEANKKINADIVVSTLPAYAASNIFESFNNKCKTHFDSIFYPPVLVIYLAYEKKSIGRELDGFGFLIPSKEKKSFLGSIWSSVIFPNRCDEKYACFTIFVGGARNPEIEKKDKEDVLLNIKKEFESIMNISGEPVYTTKKFWPKAIPQYNLGYVEHERYFDEFEKEHPGIIIAGNFRGGISVGDCIRNSESVVNKVKSLLNF